MMKILKLALKMRKIYRFLENNIKKKKIKKVFVWKKIKF